MDAARKRVYERPCPEIGMSDAELDAIRARYSRRASLPVDRYSFGRPEVLRRVQSVDRALLSMMRRAGFSDFARLRVLEVGCGSGGNLLALLRWGFDPANLVGNELLAERAAEARRVLPPEVQILNQDARTIDCAPFDIVYQSTVFSSILDDQVQQQVAETMYRLTSPGGAVLSYDFTFDNPANPDVRKVTQTRLRELFPEGTMRAKRVTLAPPIARRVGRWGPAYAALEMVPPLRTHLIATIIKPPSGGRNASEPRSERCEEG